MGRGVGFLGFSAGEGSGAAEGGDWGLRAGSWGLRAGGAGPAAGRGPGRPGPCLTLPVSTAPAAAVR